jgi:glutamate-ammonia-ligase adenylyltransferase
VIAALLPAVEADFVRIHGAVQDGKFVVLGLGKLGGREMNMLSDLDLVFIYSAPSLDAPSDGQRPLPASQYYTRLGQRVINALSVPTAEGPLYEVDMRLRPSGNSGPLASSLESFIRYHEEQAWTWERMALTRARTMAGDAGLQQQVEEVMRAILTQPCNAETLVADVAAMRERMAKARPAAPKPWDCKHRRGAIIDLEFLAQYLQLRHASIAPQILSGHTDDAFRRLAEAGFLTPEDAATCRAALGFWHQLQQVLRVSLGKVESADVTPNLLDRALVRATGFADAVLSHEQMDKIAASVLAIYRRLIENPAAALGKNTHTPGRIPE